LLTELLKSALNLSEKLGDCFDGSTQQQMATDPAVAPPLRRDVRAMLARLESRVRCRPAIVTANSTAVWAAVSAAD